MSSSTQSSRYIWINGEITPYADAKVPVLSHSLHYGTGVFEGMRAYQTKSGETALFRVKEHYERFAEGINAMGYKTTHSVEEWIQVTKTLIKKNEFSECYVRPIAYIDDSVLGLRLPKEPKVNCAIATWAWGKYLGDEGQKKGIRCQVSSFRRADVSSSLPFAKITGGYVTSVLARRESTLNGFDEAILLDPQGFVAEGSGENIFVVRNGEILTPRTGFILPGITRNSVMEIAKKLGFTVRETLISRNELYNADEIFFSGTAVEVTPIREIDHHKIGKECPGPIATKISDAFFKTVRGENPEFKQWLTIV